VPSNNDRVSKQINISALAEIKKERKKKRKKERKTKERKNE